VTLTSQHQAGFSRPLDSPGASLATAWTSCPTYGTLIVCSGSRLIKREIGQHAGERAHLTVNGCVSRGRAHSAQDGGLGELKVNDQELINARLLNSRPAGTLLEWLRCGHPVASVALALVQGGIGCGDHLLAQA
jgi:hypothetical protein